MSAGFFKLLATKYYVADPDKYVVIAGLGIHDMKIIKSGIKIIFQNATLIDIKPRNYEFKLHCMSKETLPFMLPGVFTIGPDISSGKLTTQDIENLKCYARRLSNLNEKERSDIVLGIIEGETRVSAASMTIKELFSDRMKFKDEVIKNVDKELKAFGLKVFNSNIKEMGDSDDSEYFKNTRKKIISESENQAKIDVATSILKGEVGSKEKATEMKLTISKFETEGILGVKENEIKIKNETAKLNSTNTEIENTQKELVAKSETKMKNELLALESEITKTQYEQKEIVSKNESKMKLALAKLKSETITGENNENELISKSNAKLEIIKNEQEKLINASKITFEKEVELTKIKLDKDIELKQIELEETNNKAKFKSNMEELKSKKLASATIEADAIKIEADALYYKKQKEEDAIFYKKQKESEGFKLTKQAESESIKLLYEVESEGLKKIKENFDSEDGLLKYLMIKDNLFTKLANSNAESIKGLNPKITIWNTGDNKNGFTDNISNILKTVPPLFSTIEDQTGIKIFPNIVQNDTLKEINNKKN